MADLEDFTLPDGTTRKLGNLEPPDGLVHAWNAYGSVPSTPIIPRSEWKERCDEIGIGYDNMFLLPPVDQGQIGMCNAAATASAMESTRFKQGLPYHKLSAGDLYRRIHVGSGDNGSLLEDGIKEAMANGIASTATVPYSDWHNDHTGAAAERAKYKVLEAFLCPTFDACFSAVLQGYDLISGIAWFDSYTPGPDGWLPRPGGNSGGHALHGTKPTYRTKGSGIEYGIWHQNSWGTSWGLDGKGVFVVPESAYTVGQVGGWWCCRVTVDEGGVIPEEKV